MNGRTYESTDADIEKNTTLSITSTINQSKGLVWINISELDNHLVGALCLEPSELAGLIAMLQHKLNEVDKILEDRGYEQ